MKGLSIRWKDNVVTIKRLPTLTKNTKDQAKPRLGYTESEVVKEATRIILSGNLINFEAVTIGNPMVKEVLRYYELTNQLEKAKRLKDLIQAGYLRAGPLQSAYGANVNGFILIATNDNPSLTTALIHENNAGLHEENLIAEELFLLSKQLPLTFTNTLSLTFSELSAKTLNIPSLPKITQVLSKRNVLSIPTKVFILLSSVRNSLFPESSQTVFAIVYGVVYFRQLLPKDRKRLIADLKNVLGYPALADWLEANNNKHLDELLLAIKNKYNLNFNETEIAKYIRFHDEIILRSRGLRVGLEADE